MNRNRAIAQQAGQRERRLTRFPSSTSLAAAALPWTFGFCLLHYPVHSFLLQQKLEAILMEKRPLGLPDLLVSGSWYAIPAIWAFFAFVRMALGLGDKFLIACLVGTAAVFVWFIGQTLLQWVRAGKQPTDEQQRAAIGAMWGPVFSVIWAGFVAGCSASMIVVIELNDPFSKEAVDRVVQEHPILYWAVAGAGLVIGAGGRLWTLASPSRVVTSQREADAVVSEARKDELQTRPDGDEAGRTSR